MIENLIRGAGFIIALFAWLALMWLALRTTREARKEEQHDSRVVLRHCRQELQLVRLELEAYPATRETYEIFALISQAELTIDQVAGRLLKASDREEAVQSG